MTVWADPEAVRQAALKWTPGQLACRLIGYHDWNLRNTVLTNAQAHVLTVQQTCGRGCGVVHRAEMDRRSGLMLNQWRPDYSGAPNYLMRDEDDRSVGRIDAQGRGVIRLMSFDGLPILEPSRE